MRFGVAVGCVFCFVAAQVGAQPKPKKNPVPVESSPVKVLADEGNRRFQEQNFSEAIVFFQQAYQLENNPGFLFNIALCYTKLSEWDKAQANYEAILAGIPPENPLYQRTQEKLTELQARLSGEADTPTKMTTLEVVPSKAEIDFVLVKKIADEGNQKFQEGSFGEAILLFQRAYKLDNQPGFLFNIGRCHSNLKQWSQATDTYRLVLVVTKETDPMHQKAQDYAREAEANIVATPIPDTVEEATVALILPAEKYPKPVRLLFKTSIYTGSSGLIFGGFALAASLKARSLGDDSLDIVPGKLESRDSVRGWEQRAFIFSTAADLLLLSSLGTALGGVLLHKKLGKTDVSVGLGPAAFVIGWGY